MRSGRRQIRATLISSKFDRHKASGRDENVAAGKTMGRKAGKKKAATAEYGERERGETKQLGQRRQLNCGAKMEQTSLRSSYSFIVFCACRLIKRQSKQEQSDADGT